MLNLLQTADIIDITNNYEYKSNYTLDKLFNMKKTDNLLVEASKQSEGSNIPVMAQVHAFDTEARIGDRPNFETVKAQKLLIKEKINETEQILYYMDKGVTDQKALKNFVFDDVTNMATRVMTRTSVMNGELLSTGKLVIKENNVDITVDYNMPSANFIPMTGWATPAHDILGDIQKVVTTAKAKGYTIVRAITSNKVMGYLRANTNISNFFKASNVLLTDKVLKQWLLDNFGIEFVENDEVYKTDIKGTTQRIYKEDNITWLTTDGSIGSGLFGKTPEEIKLELCAKVSLKGNIAITEYDVPDPVAHWVKASGIYLPIITDINGMFISTVAGD